MPHCIARIFEALPQYLLPSPDCHQVSGTPPIARCAAAPVGCVARSPVLPGEDTVMVRPYLVAHERREQARRQCVRRRPLRLAVHGVDLDPSLMCQREASAR